MRFCGVCKMLKFRLEKFQIVNVAKGEELESAVIHEEIDLVTVRTAEADARDRLMLIEQDAVAAPGPQQKSIVHAGESAHCTGMFHRQVCTSVLHIFWFNSKIVLILS